MKIQDLRRLIKEEIQNVLNEATDFKSLEVLNPGNYYLIITPSDTNIIGYGDDPITLLGGIKEKPILEELAQIIGGQVTPNEQGWPNMFELKISAAKFEELFNIQ